MNFKLEHACVRVQDLEKSISFYTTALGLEQVSRKDFPEWECSLVYLSDASGAFEIELTYNYGNKAAYEMGTGFSHFALVTDDIEAAMQKHKSLGIEVGELKQLPGEALRFYFIADPDGYKIEIIQKG